MVRQHHALGQARGAARVLDIGDVVDGHVIRQPSFRIQKRRPLRRIEINGVFERQIEPMACAAQDLLVVGALVLVPQEERFHPRPCQRELQLVRAVGGIHIDQRRSGSCAAHVHHDPLNAVGGPEPHAIAATNAQRPKPARHAVRLVAQFGPASDG